MKHLKFAQTQVAVLLVPILFSAFAFTSEAAEKVDWAGPGLLLSILRPDVVQNASSHCEAQVLRPAQNEEPSASAENVLTCAATIDGVLQKFTWSFGDDSPVSFWGNRYDLKKNFSVSGPFAKSLFRRLGFAFAGGQFGDMVTHIGICGPGGILCTDMYALELDTTQENHASVFCSADSENDEVYKIECVMMP